MRPLRLYMKEGCIAAAFTVHVENRTWRRMDMEQLIADGVRRMEGKYPVDGREEELCVELSFAEEFSFGAVNVRVIDDAPEVRKRHSPFYNVSRAYPGARRRGLLKLARYIRRRPDVYINLKGRDLSSPAAYRAVCSVVQHEFGHVLGLRDQYRRKTFEKRREWIEDQDLMYRTGGGQRFMGYQIKRLMGFAARRRLPLRNG